MNGRWLKHLHKSQDLRYLCILEIRLAVELKVPAGSSVEHDSNPLNVQVKCLTISAQSVNDRFGGIDGKLSGSASVLRKGRGTFADDQVWLNCFLHFIATRCIFRQ